MKRFWTEVTVADGAIALDGKPVRTPGRMPLVLPNAALADAVAEEWRGVGETVDPRAMPLTGLANAAIDRIAPDPTIFAAGLAKYGESDLLCYRAVEPPELAARQAAMWNPPLDWAERHYGVTFELAQGVMHRPQPTFTLARLATAVAGYNTWRLAGLSPVVTVTGSLVLALALAEGAIDAATAWAAAELDENWQAEQWGRDPLAEAARDTRQRDFDAGARFLRALA